VRKAIRIRVELDRRARVILNADALLATEDKAWRCFAAARSLEGVAGGAT
jgi:hypothetical protein